MTASLRSPVAIVGLGLMGGSLARALKQLPHPPVVRASTQDADAARRAVEDGVAASAALEPEEILEGARLVVYATPISVTIEMLNRHRDRISRDAIVIDTGSVKGPVIDAARAAGLADRFVGCHPMCGSERSGYDASAAALFADAVVWMVPGSKDAPVDAVSEMWRAVGARPSRLEASTHDRLVAWTSHLPQLLASALGGVLREADVRPEALGPGGRDMTRLARSPASLWTDILLRNREHLDEPIAQLSARLAAFAQAILRGDARAIERLLAEGRTWTGEP